jgi:hypothetical protein
MTKRSRTSEQLSAYLDGELSDAERAGLEQALADDRKLTRELAELRMTRALVRSLPREEAPADFARRVMARLERRTLLQPGIQAGGRTVWRLALAVAGVVLVTAAVAVYVVMLGSRGGTNTQTVGAPEPKKGPSSPATTDSGPAGTSSIAAQPLPREPDVTGQLVATGGPEKRAAVDQPRASQPAPILTAKAPAPSAAPTIYVPVNATDLTSTRRGLETAFFEMEISPDTSDDDASADKDGAVAGEGNLGYRTVAATPSRIKYVIPNVRQSQLPAVLKGLEKFRQRQNIRQDSLVSAQTALAEAGPATGLEGAKVVSQAAVLDRGKFLRSILAEAERREKAQAATTRQNDLAGTPVIASVEAKDRDKSVVSNVGIIERARGYVGDGDRIAKGKAPGDDVSAGMTEESPLAAKAGPRKPAPPVEPAAASAPGADKAGSQEPPDMKKGEKPAAPATQGAEALRKTVPEDAPAADSGRGARGGAGEKGPSDSRPAPNAAAGLAYNNKETQAEARSQTPQTTSRPIGRGGETARFDLAQRKTGAGQAAHQKALRLPDRPQDEPVYTICVVLHVVPASPDGQQKADVFGDRPSDGKTNEPPVKE